jgi:predicted glycoside hydrolase/deacetylase ChbG (UPF0249 family)
LAKRVVLCADDYGLSPGVSRAIRELLDKQRLSATSCMVVFPEFAQDGPLLRPFLGSADIGLHFSLTERRSLASVATRAHLRQMSLASIIAAAEEQVARFTDAIGRLPDYLDGHQHVHLLPVVREAVVRVAHRIGAYVRVTCEPIDAAMWRRPSPIESAYLARASRPLSRLAAQFGVPTNRGFRGVRNFREKSPFRNLFQSMIAGAGEACLVMCHPGHPDTLLGGRDAVRVAREVEFAYLAGGDFLDDLSEAGLSLARLRDAIGLDAA